DSMIAYFNLNHYGFSDWSNMGIAGDTTQGLIDRLDAIQRQNPQRVIISMGSNDLVLSNLNKEKIVENMRQIHLEISKLSEVFILSLTPVNDKVEIANHSYIAGRKNEDILMINNMLNEEFKDHFIDVSTSLMNHQRMLNEAFTKDGIHLNQTGYHVFTEIIKKRLKQTS
ncbi:MAG: GDSL-type esterase/lipase family protein, partial [Acholeplasmataceae bacterium]|nr:GDSL-type esterase/lipase family protein [Acholeplasmataceae bacterium]